MKKICLAALVLGVAMAITSCAGGTGNGAQSAGNGTQSTAGDTTQGASGKVSTGGSTSVEKVIAALSEAYMEENKGVSVTYDPTGSSAGIMGAADGALDIGLSSRALKDTETNVQSVTFALDGIAIVVNKANAIQDISQEQLAKIATGEIANWKELGGNDEAIVFLGREAGSGTRDGFESILDVTDKCKYSEELTATGAIVGKVSTNAASIGYVSLASVNDTVKALSVQGVVPSEETVQNGSYTLQRPFVMVNKVGAEPSAEAKKFMDFVMGESAAEIISNAGAVPILK